MKIDISEYEQVIWWHMMFDKKEKNRSRFGSGES